MFQYKLMDKKELLAPQLHASFIILMNKPPEFKKLHQGLQQEINKSPYGVFTELQTQEIKDPMGPDKSEIFWSMMSYVQLSILLKKMK